MVRHLMLPEKASKFIVCFTTSKKIKIFKKKLCLPLVVLVDPADFAFADAAMD